MLMKSKILLLVFLFIPSLVFSQERCGNYQVQGLLKKVNDSTFLLLNPLSMSQMQITIENDIETKTILHRNLRVLADVDIKINSLKKIKIFKINTIKSVAIDPLRKADFIKLVKEINCAQSI